MSKDEFLDKLSDCINRSYGQTLFLFNLLDSDRKKIVLLEQKIKNNHLCYCPGSKEDCEEVLAMSDGSGWAFADERYSHLDDFLNDSDKLQKECIFKTTGHKGKIINELDYKLNSLYEFDPVKVNFKRELYPAQWGIFWYHDAERTQEYKGLLNFWQDKDKIDFKR